MPQVEFQVGDVVLIEEDDTFDEQGRQVTVTEVGQTGGLALASDVTLPLHSCNDTDFHWYYGSGSCKLRLVSEAKPVERKLKYAGWVSRLEGEYAM